MGMAGFMAASLNAPLAALLAVVELSGQLEIIVPAMIVITISCITSGQLFKNRSVFTMQLDVQNLIYNKPPVEKTLQKIGVLGLMIEKFELVEKASQPTLAGLVVSNDINVPVINKTIKKIIKRNNVVEVVDYYWAELSAQTPSSSTSSTSINNSDNSHILNETDDYNISERMLLHKLIPISHQATLAEAYQLLITERCGGVYIYQDNVNDIMGIVTFEQIRQYLVTGKLVVGKLAQVE